MIQTPIAVINDFSGGQDTKTPIISMPLSASPNMRNFHCSGNANRLIKRGGFAKVNSSVVESDNLDEFYSPGYQTTDYALRDTATNTQLSQGFKANTSGPVTKVKLWLKSEGTPAGTDTITLEIQSDSSGLPSGAEVTNGIATAVDISDSLTSSYGWITFTFSTNPTLVAGTQYHLVLQGAFTISAVNFVYWGVDNYDVIFANGCMSTYDGTTWVTKTKYNACFEVYITDGVKGKYGTAIWDFASKQMLLGVFGTSIYRMDKNSAGTPDGIWDSLSGGSSWDSYTKLMLHFDGSDAATTFTDEIGNTITAVGNAQIDTAQKVFGTASGLFDGTGDYLTTPDNVDWSFGTGNFTIDFRVRFAATPGTLTFVCHWKDGNNFARFRIDGSKKLEMRFYIDGVEKGHYVMTSAWNVSADTWYHLAFVRNGATGLIFIDGVSQTLTETVAFGTNDTGNIAGLLYIGQQGNADSYLNGWIDELRISKGITRWIADFTPSTSAYSAGTLPLTFSRFWTFADWQSGRALINTDVGLYSYLGTGDVNIVAAAPLGKFMTVWKKYVFMVGVRGSPNVVRYSDLSDYTTWTAANTLNFDTNDGDVITGIRILKGKLYVFKRYSVHRISYLGSNPTFQVDPILGIGTPAHYTIKEVDMGGELGSVLIFLTSDKKLAIFDGYNIQVINDVLSERSNDLFASADDQPKAFSDMNLVYADLFHSVVKKDTYEYILYCVLNGSTSVNYAFVLDYKIGGIYPYDNQVFASSCYAISTNKAKLLYTAGYTGYMWQMESGNDDDGTAINAYWVSGKVKPEVVSMAMKMLLAGINVKEITSASTININFQYRIDWNVSWTTAVAFSFNHSDELAFGKTALFDIGTVENMFQIKLQDNSKNPAPTIYGVDLYGKKLGHDMGERAVA